MIISYGTISVPVESCKLVYIFPYFYIICMENMCSISMYINPFHFFSIYIACNMLTLINYKTILTLLSCFMSKNRTKKPCSNNQIVIMFHNNSPHTSIILLFIFYDLISHQLNLKSFWRHQ